MSDEPEQMQTIILVTTDGRRLVYFGKAQASPDDPPQITDVIVTLPKPLPAGCSWGSVDE